MNQIVFKVWMRASFVDGHSMGWHEGGGDEGATCSIILIQCLIEKEKSIGWLPVVKGYSS